MVATNALPGDSGADRLAFLTIPLRVTMVTVRYAYGVRVPSCPSLAEAFS
jgi:hypothetical protein